METRVIGFAETFYTLWNVTKEPVYVTSNNQHFLVGYDFHYNYIQNISIDIEKVKKMYPSLEIDEELRGKTTSWISKNQEDLCPHIMKFGKYYGKDINELLVEDFQYLVWLCENKWYSSNGKYANNLPEITSHFKAIDEQSQKLIDDRNNAFQSLLNNGYYEFSPDRNLRTCEDFAYISVNEGDLQITFKFLAGTFSRNEYKGFSYGLPLMNGKAKKIKGKMIRFEFTEDVEAETEGYQVIVNKISFIQ